MTEASTTYEQQRTFLSKLEGYEKILNMLPDNGEEKGTEELSKMFKDAGIKMNPNKIMRYLNFSEDLRKKFQSKVEIYYVKDKVRVRKK